MPNHCYNQLHIQGPQADRLRLLEHIGHFEREPQLDFNRLVPYPELYQHYDDLSEIYHWEEMKRRHGVTDGFNMAQFSDRNNGHGWCVQAWGTKWGAYEYALMHDYVRDVIILTFMTAWAPPLPIIQAISLAFPTISLELWYAEHGQAFSGGLSVIPPDPLYPEDDRGGAWEHTGYRGFYGG